MYAGRLRSANKRPSEEDGGIKKRPNKRQKLFNLTKIGEIEVGTWKKIFTYFNDMDLANAVNVCKSFQQLGEELFDKRHQGRFIIIMNEIGFKRIVCSFKNVITSVHMTGPTVPYSERILDFLGKVLNKSLRKLRFGSLHKDHFEHINFRRKFLKLERLGFIHCTLDKSERITQFTQWCPNLKSLTLSACTIQNSTLFEEIIPSLRHITLFNLFGDVNDVQLADFFITNSRLNNVCIDLPYSLSSQSLQVINQQSMNLEKMLWKCHDLDPFISTFQKDLPNLKELSIMMDFSVHYKNQLLQILKYLPNIEVIKVLNCRRNIMSNDDLLEFVSQCKTLIKFVIISVTVGHEMQFNYDLHRKFIQSTSDRPNIEIVFDFGFPVHSKTFTITNKWIKENNSLLVLAPRNLSHY